MGEFGLELLIAKKLCYLFDSSESITCLLSSQRVLK